MAQSELDNLHKEVAALHRELARKEKLIQQQEEQIRRQYELEKRAFLDSWKENPDRMGGAFTEEEIKRGSEWR